MSSSEDSIKLRMARPDSPEEIARRFRKEQEAVHQIRESNLNHAMGSFHIGSVPYLNSAPLIEGIEEDVLLMPPSQLAEKLGKGELDAALLSVTEVLLNDQYDVLDEVAVASLGEVKSVFLAHRKPLEQIEKIYCDPASLTSVNLLKVLFKLKGLSPEYLTLESYDSAGDHENVLLIGNPAIEFLRSDPSHQIWDLGEAWYNLTKLPFVFAVWALKRNVDNQILRKNLREAKSFGMETLDSIIRKRTEFDFEFRKDYLDWHIHYHMGSDEKRGIAKFMQLLEQTLSLKVYAPHFVS